MNNETIDITFLCVQPINISHELYTTLIRKKVSFDKINKFVRVSQKNSFSIEWLEKFYNLHGNYDEGLKELELDNNSLCTLQEDLSQEYNHVVNAEKQTFSLAPYMKNCRRALLYDIKFSYFVLIYEIDFTFPLKELYKILKYDGEKNNQNKDDLYNTIRNQLVKENDTSTLSIWGAEIQKNVILKIERFLQNCYGLTIKEGDIEIRNNTGNISCFIFDDIKNTEKEELAEKFSQLNKFAERITSDDQIETFYGKRVFYAFHGRFHTIYLTKDQDRYRFQPLQFHIQYMWFLVDRYNEVMNTINLDLMQNTSMKKLEKFSKIIHFMINKIELLNSYDNDIKYKMEIDYPNIYAKNEVKWSIPILLNSSRDYVKYFKDYLDRIFKYKNDLSQKKQNNILLTISILQLIALISVWNDYLALLNPTNLELDNRIISFFGNNENLLVFNYFTPAMIVASFLIILLYLFVRRRE